jgi:hypothetical protein
MSHRSVNRFNQREVSRAIRAARLAGERPERVEIDPATGRITVIIAQPSEAATSNHSSMARASGYISRANREAGRPALGRTASTNIW